MDCLDILTALYKTEEPIYPPIDPNTTQPQYPVCGSDSYPVVFLCSDVITINNTSSTSTSNRFPTNKHSGKRRKPVTAVKANEGKKNNEMAALHQQIYPGTDHRHHKLITVEKK